jgi:hypothetical protein
MHKLYVLVLFVSTLVVSLLVVQSSYAISSNVVISQVQLGNAASASNEFIEIYNNSATDVEITNWCLYYASATSTQNGSKLTCFLVDNSSIHLYLPTYSFAFAISSQLATAMPTLGSDQKFSATLSGTAGHVRLIDSGGVEVDKVGWGVTAMSAEGASPTAVPSVGKVLSRKTITANILQDTDVNSNDFEVVPPRTTYLYGSVYEVQDLCSNLAGIQAVLPDGYSVDIAGDCSPLPVDVCTNLDRLQTVIPNGYALDADGNCQADICQNLDGLQLVLPDGMELDASGGCIMHDECSNLPDIQADIPDGYKRGVDNNCMLDLLPLKITEMLPNAIGSDEGNEFIELYNPNDSDVDLSNYVFYVGANDTKFYSFSDGSHIGAGQYMAFSNDDFKFTLINTTSNVRLSSSDGTLIDETPVYDNPKDGMAWALIDGIWQYTNQPTPGSTNLSSFVAMPVVEVLTVSNLEPCATNQYRSPETNRCRLITTVSSASVLTPCKDGQYRSEETNRCRSIVSDVAALVSCAEGQERNPETNRCRSVTTVLGAVDLAPCKAGQERNPDTNRCRNVVSTIPQAGYAPEQTSQSSNNYIVWWSLAGVGLVAISYGVWEWRQEIARLIYKLGTFLHLIK